MKTQGNAPIIGRCPVCGLGFTSRYGRKFHARNANCIPLHGLDVEGKLVNKVKDAPYPTKS